MGFLVVDESKCKRDGICAKECPMGIIRLQEEKDFPKLVQGGKEMCLMCGHCVAVCPHEAMSHARVPIEDCPSIEEELLINEEQAAQFLRSRRSIRVYKDKPVEKEKIQRLIEVARYAPTAGNSQLLEWLVITDKDKISHLAELAVDRMRQALKEHPQAHGASYIPFVVAAWDAGYDAFLRNAPALLVASATEEARNGMVDLTLALSYLELLAPTMGLGTCWAGLLQGALLSWPSLKEVLGIPEGHPHYYPMMLGYPKFRYYRLPERKLPKITWS